MKRWWKIALVIVIAGLLAGLLLPAMQTAREPHGEAE
jgi:hypothetical protein